MPFPKRTAEEVLALCRENVRIDEDGCWIWAGACMSAGYPIVSWDYRQWLVRRLTLELSGRRIGKKQVVYSSCGVRKCVCPDHLRVGNRKLAGQQNAKHGCYPSGARRSLITSLARAKTARLPITERHNVLAARARGETLAQIGSRYGVTDDAVGHALRAWERALGPVLFLRDAA